MKVSRKLNKEPAVQRYPSHVSRAPGRGRTGLETGQGLAGLRSRSKTTQQQV